MASAPQFASPAAAAATADPMRCDAACGLLEGHYRWGKRRAGKTGGGGGESGGGGGGGGAETDEGPELKFFSDH